MPEPMELALASRERGGHIAALAPPTPDPPLPAPPRRAPVCAPAPRAGAARPAAHALRPGAAIPAGDRAGRLLPSPAGPSPAVPHAGPPARPALVVRAAAPPHRPAGTHLPRLRPRPHALRGRRQRRHARRATPAHARPARRRPPVRRAPL